MPTPVELALQDLGYTEQPIGSNRTKYGERFFPGQPSPWCAEMVSCHTRDAGASGPWHASVGFYRAQAAKEERLVDLPTALALIEQGKCISVGFHWDRDTWPDHIGWLLGLGAGVGTIKTIEGNAPVGGVDKVGFHQRSTSTVAFYCRVDPVGPVAPPVAVPVTPVAPTYPGKPVLPSWMFLTWKPNGRRGYTNHGDKVGVLQSFFKALGGGWDPGPVDSVIGPRTNDIIGRFQESSGLRKDYVVGQDTWRAAFG